jgi:hypothetical protein
VTAEMGPEPEGVAAMRGVLIGLALSVCLWAAAGLLVWEWVR